MTGTDDSGADLVDRLAAAGLRASVLVRDLDTGGEVGLDPDRPWPLASLAKVAQALVVLDRVARRRLDGAARVRVEPGRVDTPGPTGLTRFRHPAEVAVDDLVSLSVSLSDNAAADALFALVPPDEVSDALAGWGLTGLHVRHPFSALTRTPVELFSAADVDLAHSVAIGEGTEGGGHRLPQLDVARTNAGSARSLVDLLGVVWARGDDVGDARRPQPCPRPHPEARARLRGLLAANVHRHRLAPDLASDAATWSSKTGTLLTLRHEVGVVEHRDGTRIAVAVLSGSRIAASVQPAAEATLGAVARRLHDDLRDLA